MLELFNAEVDGKESKTVSRSELAGQEDANVAKEMKSKGNNYDSSGISEKRPIRNRCDWKWVSRGASPRDHGHVQKAVSE